MSTRCPIDSTRSALRPLHERRAHILTFWGILTRRPLRFSHLLAGLIITLLSACGSCPKGPCHTQGLQNQKITTPTKSIIEVRGGHHLEGLHPTLAKRARLLYERASARGVKIRFISGYRRYRVKKNVKPSKSVASWHNFGAAFDLNLLHRQSMKIALAHLDDDRSQWEMIGALAADLKLTWGRPWGAEEIFHFEWHPGHPDALRAPAFKKLQKLTGASVKDYKAAWRLFKDDKE